MNNALELAPLRPSVSLLTEQLRQLVLTPDRDTFLSRITRLQIALCAAERTQSRELARELGAQLEAIAGEGSADIISDEATWALSLPPVTVALLRHATTMTTQPTAHAEADIRRLQQAGASAGQIVAASQVIAFVSYVARLGFAIDTIVCSGDSTAAATPSCGATAEIVEHPRSAFPIMEWAGWLDGVPADSSAAVAGKTAQGESDYYRVLRNDPQVLELRTLLYDDIMTGEAALSRAEREFVALATSLATGCEFCASVHGRRHFFLSRDTTSSTLLKSEGYDVLPNERDRALAGFAAALAATPPALTTTHVGRLRTAGFTQEEIFDAASVSSMFSWANRLMLTLGQGRLPARRAELLPS